VGKKHGLGFTGGSRKKFKMMHHKITIIMKGSMDTLNKNI